MRRHSITKILALAIIFLIYKNSFIHGKSFSEKLANRPANLPEKTYGKKDWNFIVYVTANNDLHRFAIRNIEEMMQVGSTNNINILVQLDTYGQRETSRLLITKNNFLLLDKQAYNPESIHGTPYSLYKCVEWFTKYFPAKHLAVVLWDHGSGIEDPSLWGKIWETYPHKMYSIDSSSGLLKFDRKFLKDRGICFNEIFQTYITNQEMKDALDNISKVLLNGKKIDIVGMDACNMAMLEVATQIKNSTDYMVGSEEVEPGTGWNYSLALEPFTKKTLTPREFSEQIVKAYEQQYNNSYINFTQSAMNLNNHNALEDNINKVSGNLLELIKGKEKNKIISIIKKIRNSSFLTTMFANKSYIDMHHFYNSLFDQIKTLKFNKLKDSLAKGLEIIQNNVVKHTICNQLINAKGISMYFPLRSMHPSYGKTEFAKNNKWYEFLNVYLNEITKPSLRTE